jgi:hypothetical protein
MSIITAVQGRRRRFLFPVLAGAARASFSVTRVTALLFFAMSMSLRGYSIRPIARTRCVL